MCVCQSPFWSGWRQPAQKLPRLQDKTACDRKIRWGTVPGTGNGSPYPRLLSFSSLARNVLSVSDAAASTNLCALSGLPSEANSWTSQRDEAENKAVDTEGRWLPGGSEEDSRRGDMSDADVSRLCYDFVKMSLPPSLIDCCVCASDGMDQ